MKRLYIFLLTALLSAPFSFTCGDMLENGPESVTAIVISGITETPSTNSAVITFTTDISSTHIIEYGTTSGTYTDSTIQSFAEATAHSETITELTEANVYYYRIKVFSEIYGDAVSAERTFTTTASNPPTLAQKLRGIWMVGGVSGNTFASAISQIDLFDPVTATWYSSVTTLLTPVSFAGAVSYKRTVDDHHLIMVIGGFNGSTGATENSVQIYDIESDSWSSGTAMTQARANIYATRVYDKIYIFGGSGAAASTTASTGWAGNTTNYEYTIGSGWNIKGAYAAATNCSDRFTYTYGDVVYNIAGRNGGATFAAPAHDGYSIAGNAVTGGTELALATPAANVIRTGVAGVLWDPDSGPPRIILVGGYSLLTGSNQYFVTNNVTNSTAQNIVYYCAYPFTAPSAWTAGTNYPVSIGFGSAALYGNIMYYFGGATTLISTTASGQATVYSTNLNNLPAITWTSVANMPIGRYGHTAVTIQQ